jgi:hypothetical protein
LINALSLAYLMEQCQSLKVLTLTHLDMDENRCRELGVSSRPGLEIVLSQCTLTHAGTSALSEVLGRNQGPTKLNRCDIDISGLADGLRRNSRLKSLRTPYSSGSRYFVNRLVLAIASALRENKGLVDLNLRYCWVSDETWHAICDSLKTHPTLQVLDLSNAYTAGAMTPAFIASRIQALLETMKVNLGIHTMRLRAPFSEHELFRESVVPYLLMNRFRPRVRAIQKSRPIPYRAKVLGRALLAARTDANSFWMLLSGNAEVAFPSRSTTVTASTTVAAKLATPATAAATSSAAAPVVATAAAPCNPTQAASTTGASAAATVSPPIAW